ncbi:hypothetical protein ACFL5V_03470 [Fibrobacterota bacterium]
MRTIAFFISAHGFGHGVRSCEIINNIPPEHQVYIFSSLPPWFFQEEIRRTYRHINCEIDCGCVQAETVSIDIAATLEKYQGIYKNRDILVEQYGTMLKKLHIDLVLADIPSMAFAIANYAGSPAYGISNFSWGDIYHPYSKEFPEFSGVLERTLSDYALAETYFSLFPGLEGKGFQSRMEMGLVARKGQKKRGRLAALHGLNQNKKWCLVYVGHTGLNNVDWKRLEKYHDWEFLGLYNLPGSPKNYRTFQKTSGYNYADITASCDLVFGKLGYGLVSECLSFGIPILFFERFDFAEYDIFKKVMTEREQGIEIDLEKVKKLDFLEDIAYLSRRNIQPVQAAGAGNIIRALEL